MVRQPKAIDVTNMPETLRIAEEVRATNEPQLLRRDSEDLAIVMPVNRRQRKGKVMTKDDPLFGLIGIGRSGKGDISENKHKYLAEAYLHPSE